MTVKDNQNERKIKIYRYTQSDGMTGSVVPVKGRDREIVGLKGVLDPRVDLLPTPPPRL